MSGGGGCRGEGRRTWLLLRLPLSLPCGAAGRLARGGRPFLDRGSRVAGEQRRDATWKGLAYVVAVAAGVATNVFMVPVVVCEAAYLGARRELSARWRRMVVGVCTGVPDNRAMLQILPVETVYSSTKPISVYRR